MTPLKSRATLPQGDTPYMTLWGRVSRMAHLCYNFGTCNGSTSNSSDRQTQDSTTTGADRDGPLRPSLLTQPAPTYCFGHSERYCQLCELFGSRR